MSTTNFNLFLNFKDTLFQSNISFIGKKIEVWMVRSGYSEYLGECTTDAKSRASFSFSLSYETSYENPTIFLKIFDDKSEVDYFFEETSVNRATLSSGSSTLSPVVNLNNTAVGVIDESVVCNAVLTNAEEVPYANIRVQVSLAKSAEVVQEMGTATTNTLGFFTFGLVKNKEALAALKMSDAAHLKFDFYSQEDVYLDTYNYPVSSFLNFSSLIVIRKALSVPSGLTSVSIEQLSSQVSLDISEQLKNYLADHEIATLRDIRSIGGLSQKTELSNPPYLSDKATIEKLDSHAQLETLSEDYTANNAVITAGYDSVYKIATTSRVQFANAVVQAGVISDMDAMKYYSTAAAHSRMYANVYVDKLMKSRNPNGQSTINNILSLIDDKCYCSDCNAAVSPIAYLSDLISYATKHVKMKPSVSGIFDYAEGPIAIKNIQEMFCRDLCLSTQQCDNITDTICQYRIAIEVLHCYKHVTLDDTNTTCQEETFLLDERKYLTAAYYALLEQMGTTFFEVREVYNSNDLAKKAELADRLGIAQPCNIIIPDNRTVTLATDALYIDPNDPAITGAAFGAYLEAVFGLRDYNVRGGCDVQPAPYVKTWKKNFLTAEWIKEDSNTDVYSLASATAKKIILDPDRVTRDDFRYPDNSNAPYALWQNRKKFIGNIWNHVFEAPENKTTSGAQKGERAFSISGDLSAKLTVGRTFKLIDPADILPSATYTIENVRYDATNSVTLVQVSEVIPYELLTSSNLALEFSDEVNIYATTSPGTTEVEVVGNVTLAAGLKFLIRDSYDDLVTDTNDGIYTSSGSTYNSGNNRTTITISGAQLPNPSVSNRGTVAYKYHEVHAVSTDISNGILSTLGDLRSELAYNVNVYLSNSGDNDGKYSFGSSDYAVPTADVPQGNTVINLTQQLPVTSDVGTLTYLSKQLITDAVPDLGNRTLVISNANANYALLSSIIVPGSQIVSGTQTLTVVSTSTVSGGLGIKVAEPLGALSAGAVISVIQPGVVFASNDSAPLTGDYSSLSQIKIAGTPYPVTVAYSAPPTNQSVLTGTISNGSHDIEVASLVTIDAVDTSGNKFTIPTPLAADLSDLNATPRIVIYDITNSSNPDNAIEFTLQSVSYSVVGGVTDTGHVDLFVKEQIMSSSSLTGAILKHTEKSVQLTYSHPLLSVLFNILKNGAGVTGHSYDSYFDYPQLTASGYSKFPWSASAATIRSILATRDLLIGTGETSATTLFISQINLDRDSFIALANLCEKYQSEIALDTDVRVSEAEYTELFNILISSVKRNLTDKWYSEESSIKLSYKDFWLSITEPTEGNINISLDNSRVVIDPQVNGLNRMPDMPKPLAPAPSAVSVWNDRNDQLARFHETLKNVRLTNGFDAMVRLGLDRISDYDTLNFDWATLSTDLKSINAAIRTEAEKFVTETLSISLDDFAALYQVRTKYLLPGYPTADEYEKVYGILQGAYKRNILYPDWILQDNLFFECTDPSITGTYPERTVFKEWIALKAQLPKWRTNVEDRGEWQNALESRSRLPIIDPDQVYPEDFIDVTGTAYSLWNSRRITLAADYQSIGTALSGSTPILETIYGLLFPFNNAGKTMEELYDMETAGIDIRPLLGQALLTYPAYKRLKVLAETAWSQLLPTEQEEMINIIVQAKKQREYYASWNDAETANHITLSGTFFTATKPAYDADPNEFYGKLPIRRATFNSRREWERKLSGRIDQWASVDTVIDSIIDETEKQVLPILRDALVMFCGDEYATLRDNALKLEARFLTDFSMTCCQETTRVAATIDLLQKLIWNISIGIDNVFVIRTTPSVATVTLSLYDTEYFENDWKWMGSYATWRSAMFVFMYPENLLLPTLRSYQSPAFIELTDKIRGDNRLTPLKACEAAQDYSRYFEDVCNITLEATAYLALTQYRDACVNKIPTPDEATFFAFGTSKKSKKAYYHTKRTDLYATGNTYLDRAKADTDYSWWTPIDALREGTIRIIGSSAYEQEEGVRHLYIFAIVHKDLEDKLVFVRYDLVKQFWDQDYTELTLPEDADLTSVHVLQRTGYERPPRILFQGSSYKGIFANQLNRKGKDWESDDWTQIESHIKGQVIETIYAYGEFDFYDDGHGSAYQEIVLAKLYNSGNIFYKLTGTIKVDAQYNRYGCDDGTWRSIFHETTSSLVKADFKGIQLMPEHKAIGVLTTNAGQTCQVTINPSQIQSVPDIKSLYDVDYILNIWTGRSLKDILLNSEEATKFKTYINNTKGAYPKTIFATSSDNYQQVLTGNSSYPKGLGNNLYTLLYILWDSTVKEGPNGNYLNSLRGESHFWDLFGLIGDVIDRFCDEALNKDDPKHRDFHYFNDVCFARITELGPNWFYDLPNTEQFSLKCFLKATFVACCFPGYGHPTFSFPFYFKFKHLRNNDDKNHSLKRFPQLDVSPMGLVTHYGTINGISYRGFHQPTVAQGTFAAVFASESFHTDSDINQDFLQPTGDSKAAKMGGFGIIVTPSIQPADFYIINNNPSSAYKLNPTAPLNLYTISEEFNDAELSTRRVNICLENIANSNWYDTEVNREYLKEAYYFIPLFVGMQLSSRGHYEEALKWIKTVYNYSVENSVIYSGLNMDSVSQTNVWNRQANWLMDPLNPHMLAKTRNNSYLKYTVSSLAQVFIDFADAQFALDTVESVSKAEELYEFAVKLLGQDIFKALPDACNITISEASESIMCELKTGNFPDALVYKPIIKNIFQQIPFSTSAQLNEHVLAVSGHLSNNIGTPEFDFSSNIAVAQAYVKDIPQPSPQTLKDTIDQEPGRMQAIYSSVMSLDSVEKEGKEIRQNVSGKLLNSVAYITGKTPLQLENKTTGVSWLKDVRQDYPFQYSSADGQHLMQQNNMSFYTPTYTAGTVLVYNMNPQDALKIVNSYPFPYIPNPLGGSSFCVPPDPVYGWMSMSAQLNLFKIRNCMNIAGMKRELSPYAAPTDTTSGLPQIGSNGQIVLPGINNIKPTIYRYEVLIERAKVLVGIAQQMESAFLSALEKRDSEYYNLMRAKQDLALSKATVKLKELQAKVADDQVDLANLQKEKSEVQVEKLDDLINAGLNSFEQQMIGMYYGVAALQSVIAGMDFGLNLADVIGSTQLGTTWNLKTAEAVIVGVLGGIKLGSQIAESFMQAGIAANGIYAAQQRREDDWKFQKALAQQDIKIGAEQVKIAQDGVRVATQETSIANLQQQNSEDTVNFLNTKFTNVDMYDWMSGVLEKVYSYFLQEATGVARLAQDQMAFERQETAQRFIQNDYWETPTDNNAIQTPGANAVDRRGMTGSARLLQDIYKLDDYAFLNDKRKLQLSKTFSLATIAPLDFQVFKETGELNFTTLMDYFDQDFPGHYLRLIKKVKTSVIALIPPTQGIKATLTSSGISRVTIGGSVFQDVVVRRAPEMVALTGTRDASGVFELQAQDSKLLNPFEDSGVNMNWQFKMPKASNLFDYSTIADILITIDYTSLYSSDYERVVISNLGTTIQSERMISFNNEEPDAFYQWTHPAEFDNPSEVSLEISKFDFPANVSDVRIKDLKFYVVTDDSDPDQIVFSDPTGKGVQVKLTPPRTGQGQVSGIQGAAGFNNKNYISTQTNGGSLISLQGQAPIGTWKIKLNGLSDAFADNKVLDVIMIISYEGQLPNRK